MVAPSGASPPGWRPSTTRAARAHPGPPTARADASRVAISGRPRVLGKPRHQVFHGPVAFDPIARTAQQLQVALVVGTATAARHHVVNLEHLERKLHLAAVALPFLLAEQYVAVLPVVYLLNMNQPVVATTSSPALATAAALDRHPAAVYLARLRPTGRRTMQQALNRAAATFTAGAVTDALELDWSQVRYQHVAALRSVMLDQQGAAPATINKVLAAVRGTIREAWRLGLVDAETLARVADVEGVKSRRLPAGRHVESGEIRQLFAACGSDPAGARDAAMLALLYGGGLRRSEAVTLQLADYDATAGTLTVRHGKGDAARQVYATNGGKDAIDAWLQVRGHHAGALLVPVGKGGRVADRPMTPQAVMMRLRTVAERAGVRRFTPHDLRRSFVGELLDAAFLHVPYQGTA